MPRSFLIVLFSFCLSACAADRESFQLRPDARNVGTVHEIFTITNRVERPDGGFGSDRGQKLSYLRSDISVPPTHQPGELQSTPRNADPERHFVVADQSEIASKAAFKSELRQQLRQLPASEQEITLFVHGYNTSYPEGLFRLAQVQHDMQAPGIPLLFSWPSAARLVGYAHDRDSMIYSRDALQQSLFTLNSIAPKRTLLVAHSLGAMLTMEALRQTEIKNPGWASRSLAGVVLIAPDIDIDVFLSQLDRFDQLPQPFVVFVSDQDKALEASGLISGRPQRLGRDGDIETLRDYPILVIDISKFADGRNADHFTVGTSPELMDFLTSPDLENVLLSQNFDAGLVSASGRMVRTSAKRAEKAIQWILFPEAEEN